jgi:NAD(P)-dependent dehydrogenase (short-subunit alcohol dehydrogenase family)
VAILARGHEPVLTCSCLPENPQDRQARYIEATVKEINKRVAEMTVLGRAGVPDDIDPMIASLLSEDNRWVNVQRIEVSGGRPSKRRTAK